MCVDHGNRSLGCKTPRFLVSFKLPPRLPARPCRGLRVRGYTGLSNLAFPISYSSLSLAVDKVLDRAVDCPTPALGYTAGSTGCVDSIASQGNIALQVPRAGPMLVSVVAAAALCWEANTCWAKAGEAHTGATV